MARPESSYSRVIRRKIKFSSLELYPPPLELHNSCLMIVPEVGSRASIRMNFSNLGGGGLLGTRMGERMKYHFDTESPYMDF